MKVAAPAFYCFLLFLLGLELCVALVLPVFIPDAYYFDSYLFDKARVSTKQFLRGQKANIPNAEIGWINSPNVNRGNWATDRYGSRSTQELELKPIQGKNRVVFLGSSMMNGGEGVSNTETISAFLEKNNNLETMNFASMSYGVDQSYWAYGSFVKKLNPDVIVVGLDPDPISSINNMYVPLRLREEVGVPYLKPVFRFSDEKKLIKHQINVDWLDKLSGSEKFLTTLKNNDSFYARLESFKRCGFTPLASSVCYVIKKYQNFVRYLYPDKVVKDQKLLTLLHKFKDDVETDGKQILFLQLPDERMFKWSGIWSYLPDRFALRFEYLKSQGLPIVDVRSLLRASGKSARDLYLMDHLHFTKAANEIIGASLTKHCDCSKNLTVQLKSLVCC